jgi:protein-tyrosine phosphatase
VIRYIDDNLVASLPATSRDCLEDFGLPLRLSSQDEAAGRQQYVDIHCHCLPAVDDGPATMSEALALCRALADDGITTVAATPHQLGRFDDCNEAAHIREKVAVLNKELKSNGIPLTAMPGADIRVDERIYQLLEADKILTLADGGRYILLELPHEVFIDIEPLLIELSCLGIEAIISHPERHPVLSKQVARPSWSCSHGLEARATMLLKWLNQSAYLQVTAGSLLGEFGLTVQKTAWHFLSSGWASIVATDSHNLKDRRPCMRAAFKRISIELGEDIARLVCIENPIRVLEGRDMVAVYATSIMEYSNESPQDALRQARNSF